MHTKIKEKLHKPNNMLPSKKAINYYLRRYFLSQKFTNI